MSDDTTTSDQIAAARTLPEAPSGAERPSLPAPTVPALLDAGVRRHGQAPLVTFYDDATGERTELSWATFENWVAKTANLLDEELEIGVGDRVATILGTSWTTAVVTVACWRVGAVVVPVDADGPLAEGRAVLGAARPRAVFCREDLLGDLDDLLPDGTPGAAGPDVVAVGTGMGGRCAGDVGAALPPAAGRSVVLPWAEEVLAFGDEALAEPPDGGDAALLAWSATAGALVRVDQEALVAAGAAVAAWGLGDRDRILSSRPLQDVDVLVAGLVGALASGASLVLARAQPTDALLRRAADERVTLALPTAADLDAIDAAADAAPTGFRGFLCPAGAPDAVVRDAARRGWSIAVGHGLAEASCASSLVPADLDEATARWLAEADAATVGTATAFAQVAVFDGALAPHGTRGEVRVRGPVLASGYVDRPDLDAAFAGGWFATGDEGYSEVGPDGREYVFLTGRT